MPAHTCLSCALLEAFFLQHTKTFTIGGDDVSRIVAMSVSPNDEDLAILCSSAQSYNFKLSSYELYKVCFAIHSRLTHVALINEFVTMQPGDLAFKPLVSLFHSQPPAAVAGSASATEFDIVTTEAVTSNAQGRRGSISAVTNAADPWAQPNYGITGMDTCIRKPLFVTSGVDRTIRIWNYLPVGSGELPANGALTHRVAETPGELPDLTPSLELVQRFSETPATVAMHPTGLHLLVGFESSLQLLNVLMDSLKMFKEFPIRVSTLSSLQTSPNFSSTMTYVAELHGGAFLSFWRVVRRSKWLNYLRVQHLHMCTCGYAQGSFRSGSCVLLVSRRQVHRFCG
jgi:hypothetical protein